MKGNGVIQWDDTNNDETNEQVLMNSDMIVKRQEASSEVDVEWNWKGLQPTRGPRTNNTNSKIKTMHNAAKGCTWRSEGMKRLTRGCGYTENNATTIGMDI